MAETVGAFLTTVLSWNGFGFGVAGAFLAWRLYSFFRVGEWVAVAYETVAGFVSAADSVHQGWEEVMDMHGSGELDAFYILLLTAVVAFFGLVWLRQFV